MPGTGSSRTSYVYLFDFESARVVPIFLRPHQNVNILFACLRHRLAPFNDRLHLRRGAPSEPHFSRAHSRYFTNWLRQEPNACCCLLFVYDEGPAATSCCFILYSCLPVFRKSCFLSYSHFGERLTAVPTAQRDDINTTRSRVGNPKTGQSA